MVDTGYDGESMECVYSFKLSTSLDAKVVRGPTQE